MKTESYLILAAIGALGYFLLKSKPQETTESAPPIIMEQPAPIITPVVVVPPVITPPQNITTTTIYDVVLEAPQVPDMIVPQAIVEPSPPPTTTSADNRSADVIAYELWRDVYGADPSLDPASAKNREFYGLPGAWQNEPAPQAPPPEPAPFMAPQTPLQKILDLPADPILEMSPQEIEGRQLSKEHAPGWGVFANTPQGYEALAQHNAPEPDIFSNLGVPSLFGGQFPWS